MFPITKLPLHFYNYKHTIHLPVAFWEQKIETFALVGGTPSPRIRDYISKKISPKIYLKSDLQVFRSEPHIHTPSVVGLAVFIFVIRKREDQTQPTKRNLISSFQFSELRDGFLLSAF